MHLLNFIRDRRGNIAMMAAILLALMVGFTGAAIDFYSASNLRAELQSATDAAALAGGSPFIKDSERERIAKRAFKREFRSVGKVMAPATVKVVLKDSTIRIEARSKMRTSFIQILGAKSLAVDVSSVASFDFIAPEIALVLDVSGSMNAPMGASRRLDALKSAATNLIDTVDANAKAAKRPKYAVVPFNMTVNVGAANAGFVDGTAHPLFASDPWAGCVFERRGDNRFLDRYAPGATDGSGKWVAYVSPPEPNRTGACINASDGGNDGYRSVQLNPPGSYEVATPGPNYNCVRHAITPLSEDADKVRDAIRALTAEGNMGTIIAPGVSWGMRSLTESAPFTEADPAGSGVRKIMVVITDGELTTEAEYGTRWGCEGDTNTTTPYAFNPADFGLDGAPLTKFGARDELSPYGYILDSDPFGTSPVGWSDVSKDLIDISIEACDEAKKEKIEVFTIAASDGAGPGTKVYDLLKDCASSEDKFFYASDPATLDAAFKSIADEVISVRLTE